LLLCAEQTLVSIYLLPDVTSRTKRIILLYMLCDLISLAATDMSKAQVVAVGLHCPYFHEFVILVMILHFKCLLSLGYSIYFCCICF